MSLANLPLSNLRRISGSASNVFQVDCY